MNTMQFIFFLLKTSRGDFAWVFYILGRYVSWQISPGRIEEDLLLMEYVLIKSKLLNNDAGVYFSL